MELLQKNQERAFFLGHPVYILYYVFSRQNILPWPRYVWVGRDVDGEHVGAVHLEIDFFYCIVELRLIWKLEVVILAFAPVMKNDPFN